MRLAIDARNQPIAGEHRQAEVAPPTFGRGHEDLADVIEAEQQAHAVAIPQQRIERRQQHAAVASRAGRGESLGELEIGRLDPTRDRARSSHQLARHDGPALDQSPQRAVDLGARVAQPPGLRQRAGGGPAETFERAQQENLEGVGARHLAAQDLGGDDALGKVVGPLEGAPLADRELAARPQRVGEPFGELEVPPPGAALALEVDRAQRSFGADALDDRGRVAAMLGEQVAPPRMATERQAPEREHRIELDRKPARFVAPVLEQRLAGLEQRLAERRIHAFEPRQQHQRVTAGAGDRDRVELEIAEAIDDLERGLARATAGPRGASRQRAGVGAQQARLGERRAGGRGERRASRSWGRRRAGLIVASTRRGGARSRGRAKRTIFRVATDYPMVRINGTGRRTERCEQLAGLVATRRPRGTSRHRRRRRRFRAPAAARVKGDAAAREELARASGDAAFRFALQLVGDRELARDVAQDSVLRLFASLRRLDPERPLQPWLFSIVRNRVIDLRRRARSRGERATAPRATARDSTTASDRTIRRTPSPGRSSAASAASCNA